MSMKVTGPPLQGGPGASDPAHMAAFSGASGHKQNGGQNGGSISFGQPSTQASQHAQVNFGAQPPALSDSRVNAAQKPADGGDGPLGSQMKDLVQQILQLIAQMLQNHQNGAGGNAQSSGEASGKSTGPVANAEQQPAPASAEPAASAAPAQPSNTQPSEPVTPDAAATLASTSASAEIAASPAATSIGDAASAGSGPRAFNITNTQDHPIKIGQFDQHDTLTAELTLQPGQKGTMKFENDTTGLLKQADADGAYKADASRLEFYNGFINTSDIDGRNAAIHATDGKDFEIGDTRSVADKASSDIVSVDAAGDKTVAGFYDGSSDTMKKGGEFLTQTLGTDMTYMHPNDDTLGQGRNPMRHTDAMSLDVTFGKA